MTMSEEDIYLPTEEEINEMCRSIREEWDDHMRRKRAPHLHPDVIARTCKIYLGSPDGTESNDS